MGIHAKKHFETPSQVRGEASPKSSFIRNIARFWEASPRTLKGTSSYFFVWILNILPLLHDPREKIKLSPPKSWGRPPKYHQYHKFPVFIKHDLHGASPRTWEGVSRCFLAWILIILPPLHDPREKIKLPPFKSWGRPPKITLYTSWKLTIFMDFKRSPPGLGRG